MTTNNSENFYRLVTLLIDGGTMVLRRLLDQHVQASGYTLRNFLLSNQGIIFDLQKKKVFHQVQVDKLLPQQVSPDPDMYTFDLTILIALLRTVCDDTSIEIEQLRNYRNDVYGHTAQASIDFVQFQQYWSGITSTLKALTTQVTDPTFSGDLNAFVCKVKNGALEMTSSIQILADWYSNDLPQLKQDIGTLKLEAVATASEVDNIEDKVENLEVVVETNKSECQSQFTGTSSKMVQMDKKIKDLTLNVDSIKSKITTDVSKMEAEVNQIKDVIQEVRKNGEENVSDFQTQISSMSSAVYQVQENITKVTSDLNTKTVELKTDTTEMSSQLKNVQNSVTNIKSDFQDLTEGVKNNKSEVDILKEKMEAFSVSKAESRIQKKKKNFQELQSTLLNIYSSKAFSTVQVSPMNEEVTIPIDELYTNVIIVEEKMVRVGKKGQVRKRKVPVKSYNDIFFRGKTRPEQIYVVGPAGRGKTTWCTQIVNAWCKCHEGSEDSILGADNLGSANTNDVFKSSTNLEQTCLSIETRGFDDSFSSSDSDTENYAASNENDDDTASDETDDKIEQQNYDCMRHFDFLFFIPLRFATKHTSILDAFCHTTLEKYPWLHNTVKKTLQECPEKVLIISDGLDEHPQSVLSKQCLGRSTMVTTTRPWKYDVTKSTKDKPDLKLEIQGLTEEGVERLIGKVLRVVYKDETEDKIDECMDAIKESNLMDTAQIPLLLTYIVHLWYKDGALSSSLTRNMTALLVCIIEKGRSRLTDLSELEQEWSREKLPGYMADIIELKGYQGLLLSVAQLAFDGLTSSEPAQTLVFEGNTLLKYFKHSPETELQACLHLGLLSQSDVSSLLKKETAITFFHKLIQELFAAVLMAYSEEAFIKMCQFCDSIEMVLDMENVYIFLCGIDPSVGSRFSQHIAHLSELTEWRKENFALQYGICMQNDDCKPRDADDTAFDGSGETDSREEDDSDENEDEEEEDEENGNFGEEEDEYADRYEEATDDDFLIAYSTRLHMKCIREMQHAKNDNDTTLYIPDILLGEYSYLHMKTEYLQQQITKSLTHIVINKATLSLHDLCTMARKSLNLQALKLSKVFIHRNLINTADHTTGTLKYLVLDDVPLSLFVLQVLEFKNLEILELLWYNTEQIFVCAERKANVLPVFLPKTLTRLHIAHSTLCAHYNDPTDRYIDLTGCTLLSEIKFDNVSMPQFAWNHIFECMPALPLLRRFTSLRSSVSESGENVKLQLHGPLKLPPRLETLCLKGSNPVDLGCSLNFSRTAVIVHLEVTTNTVLAWMYLFGCLETLHCLQTLVWLQLSLDVPTAIAPCRVLKTPPFLKTLQLYRGNFGDYFLDVSHSRSLKTLELVLVILSSDAWGRLFDCLPSLQYIQTLVCEQTTSMFLYPCYEPVFRGCRSTNFNRRFDGIPLCTERQWERRLESQAKRSGSDMIRTPPMLKVLNFTNIHFGRQLLDLSNSTGIEEMEMANVAMSPIAWNDLFDTLCSTMRPNSVLLLNCEYIPNSVIKKPLHMNLKMVTTPVPWMQPGISLSKQVSPFWWIKRRISLLLERGANRK